ncbi:hypothetical protein LIER_33932 [Lithospermum erythrorhizon]|uniref:Reverse transcriptase n=1 Tax=Lithospermum erythrorhizon TaxID=34254 RepID=A0AAV3S0C2_LITER
MFDWNEVCLCKLLWNIASRKETLWVQWVHTVRLKGPLWRFLNAQERASIQLPYDVSLRDALPLRLPRQRRQIAMVLRNDIPMHEFITWVLFHGKLPTKDRLVRWGVHVDVGLMLQKLGAYRGAEVWQVERQWCIANLGGKSFQKRMLQIALMCIVYVIWQEHHLYHRIVSIMYDRACSWRRELRRKVVKKSYKKNKANRWKAEESSKKNYQQNHLEAEILNEGDHLKHMKAQIFKEGDHVKHLEAQIFKEMVVETLKRLWKTTRRVTAAPKDPKS